MKKVKKKTATKKPALKAVKPALKSVKKPNVQELNREMSEFVRILNEAIVAGKEKRTAVLNNGAFGFIIVKGDVWMLHATDCKAVQVMKGGEPVNAKRVVVGKDGLVVNYTHKVRFTVTYDIGTATADDDGIHQIICVHFHGKSGNKQFNIPEFAIKRILATAVLTNKVLELTYADRK